MTFRPASLLLSAALVLGGAGAVVGPASIACAAEAPQAALVVDTGEAEYTMCVALPDDEVSGIELIRLAGEQHGLQYSLGFGGAAVCQLANVGPEGDDCFADHPDFWGYWRGDGSGGWRWSGTGAGSTTVEDGDVEGWSWGSGQDGATHPRPPTTTHASVCGAPPRDDRPAERKEGAEEGPAKKDDGAAVAPAPVAPAPGSGGDESRPRKTRAGARPGRMRERARSQRRAARPEPSPSVAAVVNDGPRPLAASARADRAGPSAGVAAALAGSVVVGAAGLWLSRRRRRSA